MDFKLESTYKGTRILAGNLANYKRQLINKMIDILLDEGFDEIMIPIIQKEETFSGKVGEENNNMMYTFQDRGNRDLCLAPEYTAIVQQAATEKYIYNRQEAIPDVKLFYIGQCFRGERPQNGRYREFTQFGVEILNPSQDYTEYLKELSCRLMSLVTDDFTLTEDVTRGLDYYEEGKGFEISCDSLGAQKQVLGGGKYDNGIGFALGIDRLIILEDKKELTK